MRTQLGKVVYHLWWESTPFQNTKSQSQGSVLQKRITFDYLADAGICQHTFSNCEDNQNSKNNEYPKYWSYTKQINRQFASVLSSNFSQQHVLVSHEIVHLNGAVAQEQLRCAALPSTRCCCNGTFGQQCELHVRKSQRTAANADICEVCTVCQHRSRKNNAFVRGVNRNIRRHKFSSTSKRLSTREKFSFVVKEKNSREIGNESEDIGIHISRDMDTEI